MAIIIKEDPDLIPLCPYCEHELTEIAGTTPRGNGTANFMAGKRTVYACPSCRKALGVSHRKGFFMG